MSKSLEVDGLEISVYRSPHDDRLTVSIDTTDLVGDDITPHARIPRIHILINEGPVWSPEQADMEDDDA